MREGEAKLLNRWCILGVVVHVGQLSQASTGLWTPPPSRPCATEEARGGDYGG